MTDIPLICQSTLKRSFSNLNRIPIPVSTARIGAMFQFEGQRVPAQSQAEVTQDLMSITEAVPMVVYVHGRR